MSTFLRRHRNLFSEFPYTEQQRDDRDCKISPLHGFAVHLALGEDVGNVI